MGVWMRRWALWALCACMMHMAAGQALTGSFAPFAVTVQNPQVSDPPAQDEAWLHFLDLQASFSE